MPSYNKNSVFAVSSAGTIPNKVDDLIFFEDINKNEIAIWNEFERIMSTGDYEAAHTYIKGYAEVHGYFGDLYNLMVNRIKAVQNFLVLNETNINNATGVFDSFKKPEIFVYQQEPDTPKDIIKDQVWIGPKGYFDEDEAKESINKLKMTLGNYPPTTLSMTSIWGTDMSVVIDEDGYVTINGGSDSLTSALNLRIGLVPKGVLSNGEIWSYWNYYVSGSVENYKSGSFEFDWFTPDNKSKSITLPTSRTANMHANLISVDGDDMVELFFRKKPTEIYHNLKVGFMICKTSDTSPNQKYVKYEGA